MIHDSTTNLCKRLSFPLLCGGQGSVGGLQPQLQLPIDRRQLLGLLLRLLQRELEVPLRRQQVPRVLRAANGGPSGMSKPSCTEACATLHQRQAGPQRQC